jgi:hypothetical protein
LKETVLFKIDTGANVTLCDRILYDHGVRRFCAARTLVLLMAPLLQFVTLQAMLAMTVARTLPWLMPRWVSAPRDAVPAPRDAVPAPRDAVPAPRDAVPG